MDEHAKVETRESIEQSRARLTVLAEELARRTSVDYLKHRAKRAAADEARSVMVPLLPWTVGLIGAGIAAAIALKVSGKRGLPVKRAISKVARRGASGVKTGVKAVGKSAGAASRGAAEAFKTFWIVRGVKSRFANKWVSGAVALLIVVGAVAGMVVPSPAGGDDEGLE